jgi:hypothetical protein
MGSRPSSLRPARISSEGEQHPKEARPAGSDLSEPVGQRNDEASRNQLQGSMDDRSWPVEP